MTYDETELTAELDEVTDRLTAVTRALDHLMDITDARWCEVNHRWIVPLPCQEPVMKDLAPEELLQNDLVTLIVVHHGELWHAEVMQRGIPVECIYHGSDKEKVIVEGVKIYNERFRGGEET